MKFMNLKYGVSVVEANKRFIGAWKIYCAKMFVNDFIPRIYLIGIIIDLKFSCNYAKQMLMLKPLDRLIWSKSRC